MSTAEDVTKGDLARSALVSDIRELKDAGQQAVTAVESKLPLVIGGALGLLALGGVALALRPKRRQWLPAPTSLVGKAARSAALSILTLVAHRLATRAIDRVLPEKQFRAESRTARNPA